MKALPSSWQHKPFTEGSPFAFQASFSDAEMARIEQGFIPSRMEEKWFIFYDAPYLFFHRSWTGLPVYRLKFERTPAGSRVVEALFSHTALSPNMPIPQDQAQSVHSLISSLLLPAPRVAPQGAFKKPWWRFW